MSQPRIKVTHRQESMVFEVGSERFAVIVGTNERLRQILDGCVQAANVLAGVHVVMDPMIDGRRPEGTFKVTLVDPVWAGHYGEALNKGFGYGDTLGQALLDLAAGQIQEELRQAHNREIQMPMGGGGR